MRLYTSQQPARVLSKMPATILIVDDQRNNRDLLEALLRPEGHNILVAEDGKAALELFSHHEPDLVLLDVMMPKPNGLDVCRAIKSSPDSRLTPVVLVTALSAIEDRVAGIEAGADDFLTKPIDCVELLARVRSLLALKGYTDELERAESVLMALARSIESKDPYTEGHCDRLHDLAALLGEHLGLPEHEIVALRRAGIVHDMGKVAVPDSILLKRGSLTDQEWTVVHRHPLVGEQICAPLKSFRALLPIIRHHHEKMDGSGYPDHIKGEQIPVTARVLQITDIYDALTTERPYKPALTPAEALKMMREEVDRGWWDPDIFTRFEKLLAERTDL
jgi:putative two-component system response regulator